ncbi:MAG: tRNA lysidine(34) synthetase TilS [Firmicutes bacterium]|nr:tRNA lysidine(34) synthetase TilS [Bacillota bacterium]
MLGRSDGVLVALSGGPDSSALLHALLLLAPRLQLRVQAAHVHHGIRGASADRDAEAARALASRLAVPFRRIDVDVRTYAHAQGLSLETAARQLRLEALERTAREEGCRRVALGHTADDQAETVLMWVLRGTGPAGLAGIPPVRGVFVRPLLGVWRREVLAYCRAAGLRPVEDETNRSPRFLRNRIRFEVLPYLESTVRPGVRRALVRLASVALDEQEYMRARVDEVWRRIATPGEGGRLELDARALGGLHPALGRRILVRAYEEVSGGHRGALGLVHIEALWTAVARGRGGVELQLPGRIVTRLMRGRLVLERVATLRAKGPTGREPESRGPACYNDSGNAGRRASARRDASERRT